MKEVILILLVALVTQASGICKGCLCDSQRGFACSLSVCTERGDNQCEYPNGFQECQFVEASGGLSTYQYLFEYDDAEPHIVAENSPTLRRLYSGDVNNDNGVDVIALLEESNTRKIVWFQNEGRGVFSQISHTIIEPESSILPDAFVVADLDSDGSLDVAWVQVQTALPQLDLVWMRNNGWGTFESANIFDQGFAISEGCTGGASCISTDLIAVDVDNDGDLDLVYLHSSYDALTVVVFRLRSTGDNKLVSSTQIYQSATSTIRPQTIQVFDADRDGDVDIVLAGSQLVYIENLLTTIIPIDNTTMLYDFGSSFVDIGTNPISDVSSAQYMTYCDVDTDGYPDLVMRSEVGAPQIVWYRNVAAGTWGSRAVLVSDSQIIGTTLLGGAENVPICQDFDGDGDDDLIVLSNINIYDPVYLLLDNDYAGSSSFTSHVLYSFSPDDSLSEGAYKVPVLADLDSDGDLDLLAVEERSFSIKWLENTAKQAYLLGCSTLFNRIASTNFQMQASYKRGGTGVHVVEYDNEGTSIRRYSNDPSSLTPLSFDIMVTDLSNWDSVLFDTGTSVILEGDLNNDGDLDLIRAPYFTDAITPTGFDVWIQDKNNNYTYSSKVYSGTSSEDIDTLQIILEDFNNDDHLDMLVNIPSSLSIAGELLWLANDGTGTFSTVGGRLPHTFIPSSSSNPVVNIGSGDLDNDGDIDLIVCDSTGIYWSQNLLSSGQFFSTKHVITQDVACSTVVEKIHAADFTGDGFLDLLVTADDSVLWLENVPQFASQLEISNMEAEPVGPVTFEVNFLHPTANYKLRVLDIDGDGDPDWLQSLTGVYDLFLRENTYMNTLSAGREAFSYQSISTSCWDFFSFGSTLDFDGDGDIDFSVINTDSQSYHLITSQALHIYVVNSSLSDTIAANSVSATTSNPCGRTVSNPCLSLEKALQQYTSSTSTAGGNHPLFIHLSSGRHYLTKPIFIPGGSRPMQITGPTESCAQPAVIDCSQINPNMLSQISSRSSVSCINAQAFNLGAALNLRYFSITNSSIGGLTISDSKVYMDHVKIRHSSSRSRGGGGMAILSSSMVIMSQVLIADCSSPNEGGGIYVSASQLVCRAAGSTRARTDYCLTAERNTATAGGAIAIEDAETINLFNARFTNNIATGTCEYDQYLNGGGAIMFASERSTSRLLLLDCVFDQNSASNGNGGALLAAALSEVSIVRSTFTSNFAQNLGGALYLFESFVDIFGIEQSSPSSSSFVSNIASVGGGAVFWFNVKAPSLSSAIYASAWWANCVASASSGYGQNNCMASPAVKLEAYFTYPGPEYTVRGTTFEPVNVVLRDIYDQPVAESITQQHNTPYAAISIVNGGDFTGSNNKILSQSGEAVFDDLIILAAPESHIFFLIGAAAVVEDGSLVQYDASYLMNTTACPTNTTYSSQIGICVCSVGKNFQSYSDPCFDCNVGSYSDTIATSCIPCEVGKYQSESGQTHCRRCEQGRYINEYSAASCDDCDPGWIASSLGSTECVECESGYSNSNRSACLSISCPAASSLNPDTKECTCTTGYYMVHQDPQAVIESGDYSQSSCLPCDQGMDCSRDGISQTSLQTESGFFWYFESESDTAIAYECPFGDIACPVTSYGYRDNFTCNTGYTGIACAVCADGYYLSSLQLCKACGGDASSSLIAFAVVAGVVGLIGVGLVINIKILKAKLKNPDSCLHRWYQKIASSNSNWTHKVAILIAFWQILAVVDDVYTTPWPEFFSDGISYTKIFLGNVFSLLGVDCVVNVSHYDRLMFQTVAPLSMLVILIVTAKVFDTNGNIAKSNMCIKGIVVLMLLSYPGISLVLVQTLECRKMGTTYYLEADYDLTCWTGEHNFYAVYSVVLILLVSFGWPAFVFGMLYQHREQLEDEDFKIRYGWLYNRYQPERYYWEVWEIARKFVMNCLVVFFGSGTSVQMALGMFCGVIAHLAHSSYQPYVDRSNHLLQHVCLGTIWLTLFTGLLLRLEVDSETRDLLAGIVLVLNFCVPIFALLTVYFTGKKYQDQLGKLKKHTENESTNENENNFQISPLASIQESCSSSSSSSSDLQSNDGAENAIEMDDLKVKRQSGP